MLLENEIAICASAGWKSKMIFVGLRKLITVFVLTALLVSTGVAETSLCTVNCALAGLTSSPHEKMHPPQHEHMRNSAKSMAMRMTSQRGPHEHMDMSSTPAGNESEIGSRRCAGDSDSVVLASGTKFVSTKIVDMHSNLAITGADSGNSVQVVDRSIPRDSLPPPAALQTPSAPIRI